MEVRKYKSDPGKFALLPATAIARHPIREQLLRDMAEYGNDCSFNKTEGKKDAKIGVISSGISYQHAREAFGDDAAFLKLGLTYPFPEKLVKEFCSRHETLYVIEENDPYLEMHIKSLGFTGIHGKDLVPKPVLMVCRTLVPCSDSLRQSHRCSAKEKRSHATPPELEALLKQYTRCA